MNSLSKVCGVSYAFVTLGALGSLLLTLGCGGGGVEKPDHIPDLASCTITITHNGSPVEGASVLLAPESGQFSAAGITDSNGVAVVKTDGKYEGAVPGSYKVSVTKREKLESDLGPTPEDPADYAAYQAKLKAQPKPKHLLPEKYASFGTTDLKVTVSEGTPTEETLELTD